jgi:D-alanyl-D-alanine carboxypeptidase (penicillin-binding protein 5/6)
MVPTSKIKLILTLCFIFILIFSPRIVDASKRKYRMTCRSAIFSDSTIPKRLYGKGVHSKVPPASTTKVMTALLVMERLSLNQYVTVGSQATFVQPTKISLSPGEEYKVGDLLHASLIQSANDASVVLAEAVAGSEEKFVEFMNARAKALGAHHTKFANAHGLPAGKRLQHTTAYDMYLIFREAMRHGFFRAAIKKKYETIYSRDGRKITLKSHNKILFNDWKKKIYGKTGYTRAARSCFVGTLDKNAHTLIIAVFGCTDRWNDIKHIVSRYGGVSLF